MTIALATSLPVLLALAVSGAADDPFSCGPFLLQPGTRTMTVVVDHETPVATLLRYGPVDREQTDAVTHAVPERHHVFALEGLVPDTLYEYSITSDGLSTGTHAFRTLPERPERYRVLALGDVRSQPDVWAKLSMRMFEHEPDALFAIGTGDYPFDGTQYGQWVEQFFVPAREFLGRVPMWPVIGNHENTRRHDDVTQIESSHFFSLFDLPGNERWYRVDHHLMTLLVLDSNSPMGPQGEQYEWLRSELRSPRNRFTLVAFHHPPLTSGPHGMLESDGTPREWSIDEGRRFLVPLFEMYAVDLVLTGHDHLYERSLKGGVTYVVTGGGGAPLYVVDTVANPYQQSAAAAYHYVTLDIDASGIDLMAIDGDGQVIDTARVASTAAHVERRMQAVRSLLEHATQLGPFDASARTIAVTLHNPFDQPLEVELQTGRKGARADPLRETLPAGGQRAVSWALEVGDLEREPWRSAVLLDLRLRFSGRDQALDVEVESKRKVTVYSPVYGTKHLDSVVVDGDLTEWGHVPAMQADSETPIVLNRRSYGGPSDFAATLRLAWSDGWLHLAADIVDDALVDDGTSGIDRSDALRVQFELPARSPRVVSYAFSAGGRAESTAELTGVVHAARATDGGWTLEASFALESLDLGSPDGQPLRLSCDFLFVDRDREDGKPKPSYHRFWTQSRSRWDTSTFGVLVLED